MSETCELCEKPLLAGDSKAETRQERAGEAPAHFLNRHMSSEARRVAGMIHQLRDPEVKLEIIRAFCLECGELAINGHKHKEAKDGSKV